MFYEVPHCPCTKDNQNPLTEQLNTQLHHNEVLQAVSQNIHLLSLTHWTHCNLHTDQTDQ